MATSNFVGIFVLCSSLLKLPFDTAAQPPDQRFNVIFILADDLGWGDLSYTGNTQIPTPNIDMLAQDGVILTNHYSQPTCTPSRAALMTGAYPIRYGLQGRPLRSNQRAGLNNTFKLMPEYFKEAGYATHIVGKWHLGHYQLKYTPLRRGFDSHVGFYNGGIDYWNHFHLDLTTSFNALDMRKNNEPLWNVSGKFATHIYLDRVKEIVTEQGNSGTPFFIYLSPNNVHCLGAYGPQQSPMEHYSTYSYIGKYDRVVHAGNVHELDMLVGEVVLMLKEKNLLRRTIIAFVADNGGAPVGFTANTSPNYPFRGGKGTVAEGGVHTAAFFWAPNLPRRGVVNHQLFHITDWLPTLMHATGRDGNSVRCKDGVDQWNVLMNGGQSPRTEILINFNQQRNQYALRNQNFKIMFDPKNVLFNNYDWYKPTGSPNPDSDAVPKARQRSIVATVLRCFHGQSFAVNPQISLVQQVLPNIDTMKQGQPCEPTVKPCLFDLSTDPYEMNNLYDQNQQKFNELYERLQFYAREAKPLVNTVVDPGSNPYLDGSGFWKSWVADHDNSLPGQHT